MSVATGVHALRRPDTDRPLCSGRQNRWNYTPRLSPAPKTSSGCGDTGSPSTRTAAGRSRLALSATSAMPASRHQSWIASMTRRASRAAVGRLRVDVVDERQAAARVRGPGGHGMIVDAAAGDHRDPGIAGASGPPRASAIGARRHRRRRATRESRCVERLAARRCGHVPMSLEHARCGDAPAVGVGQRGGPHV